MDTLDLSDARLEYISDKLKDGGFILPDDFNKDQLANLVEIITEALNTEL